MSYGYFSTSLMLTLLLSEDFGLSDSTAGWYYGAFGTLTSIYGFAMGFVIDNLGVRLRLCHIVALHPRPSTLHDTGFTNILGASLSETTMRPNPRCGSRCSLGPDCC